MASKMIKKALRFSVKVIWHSAMSKNLIKPMENEVSEMSKTRCKNPYKTNGILMNFEQKVENGLQNHHFPNGIFEFRHMRKRKVEKHYKTNGKHAFSKVAKSMQKTL